MELTRKDFVYLKILYKKGCTSFFHSMTLVEIMDVTKTKRASTYRNLQRLLKSGYIDKGAITEQKSRMEKRKSLLQLFQITCMQDFLMERKQ